MEPFHEVLGQVHKNRLRPALIDLTCHFVYFTCRRLFVQVLTEDCHEWINFQTVLNPEHSKRFTSLNRQQILVLHTLGHQHVCKQLLSSDLRRA